MFRIVIIILLCTIKQHITYNKQQHAIRHFGGQTIFSKLTIQFFPTRLLAACDRSTVLRQSYSSSSSSSLLTWHRQLTPHGIPAWKQSQYFFKQPVLRQLQPLILKRFACKSETTLGINALLLRESNCCLASSLSRWCSYNVRKKWNSKLQGYFGSLDNCNHCNTHLPRNTHNRV